jgi:hypothetical protein
MRTLIAVFATLCLFIGYTAPAGAALMAMESQFGPETIIRDTETGLEFLKPSVNGGLTFTQLQAELEPDGRFGNFRLSTGAEFISATAYFGGFDCSDCDIDKLSHFSQLFGEFTEFLRIDVFSFVENDLTYVGAFSLLLRFGMFPEFDFQLVSHIESDPLSLLLVRNVSPIPEASASALFCLGLTALLLGVKKIRTGFLLAGSRNHV